MNKNYNKMFGISNNEEGKLEGTKSTVGVMDDPTQVVPSNPEDDKQQDDKTVPPKQPIEVVVNCQLLNVRKEPNKNSDIICFAKKDESLLVEEIVDGWAHVHTGPGQEGYVMAEFVTET